MTQLEKAKKNIATPEMKHVLNAECLPQRLLLELVKTGKLVILKNNRHKSIKPCAVGSRTRTKVNANIGTSTDKASLKTEMAKLESSIKYGADTVMDLSVGGDLKKTRNLILNESTLPVGTVPVYEIAVNAQKKRGSFLRFGTEDILDTLQEQAEAGVDFFTLHSGVTRKSLEALKKERRLLDIVSRGGAILASWMKHHKKENPFYENFDRILDICYRFDVTISLGDGLRPGSIFDATDKAQIKELNILGELAKRAKARNVQVIIEGPGHVPLNQIEENIRLEKRLCNGAPFYVLGPLVTDVAAGYDHINAAIGGALAASFGADFLCYVTPSEHLRHPSVEDVRDGVIASRIAAHAADLVKKIPGAYDWDRKISAARKRRDWKEQIRFSIDPERAKELRLSSKPKSTDVCTMCGNYCSIKLMEECLRAN